MQLFPDTIILRHKKENLKKCSLRGLEQNPSFKFYTYPRDHLPDLAKYIVLDINAPILTPDDAAHGIFLLDATWRYAAQMSQFVNSTQKKLIPRSLPPEWKTAYPRRQEDCPAPERGLASIEAIFVSHLILGRDTKSLLDGYYWKDLFLNLNRESILLASKLH